jgi:phage terminase small subunit
VSDLTDKQRLFVQHYVACLNATEAAARAGYSGTRASLASIGYALLRNVEIRAAVDMTMAEHAMPKAEILSRLTEMARGNLDGFFSVTGRGIKLDLKAAQAAGLMHLVKKYSKSIEGTVTIELYDAQAALVQLGKHYKLWTDVQEHSGELTMKSYATKDASPDAWSDTPTE